MSYINEYSKINGFYNKSTGIAIRDAYIKNKELYIPKYGNVIIPSGLIVKIPEGYGLIAYNRSSVASKLGLILGACVIDYNYLKEIYINLINTSRNEVFIKENTKICQLVVVPVVDVDIVEKDFDTSNSRGGFGSTDNTT
ncbi:MAG: deoxyuridine 5'-triphosphate nucleotidohydrolase [Candidatus Sericytochromatia bacterium]|nr:MAG: deoxyuridine 5'-triphosphate nucleotidohydrolase [Candidatus Sericytochromatia bacterium]